VIKKRKRKKKLIKKSSLTATYTESGKYRASSENQGEKTRRDLCVF
jgi:hypothetical protein